MRLFRRRKDDLPDDPIALRAILERKPWPGVFNNEGSEVYIGNLLRSNPSVGTLKALVRAMDNERRERDAVRD